MKKAGPKPLFLVLKNSDDTCVLKPLRESDARELFRITDENRKRLRRWLPWLDRTKKWKDTLAFIRGTQKSMAKRTGITVGIWKGERIAGVAGYNQLDWMNKKAELGYWIAGRYAGQGLVTKACRLLVDNAFRKWKFNKVEIHCGVTNQKSRAILERLRFKKEGTVRQREWLYDHYADHVIYGMLAKEWKRNR
jgi:ribosomal-protein-serine acetyltransferase